MTLLSAKEALSSRKSIRAFLDKPVDRKTIEDILALAARAPSGSNSQPWLVRVLTGNKLKSFSNALMELSLSGEKIDSEYQYYPVEWNEPYLTRRRTVGWQLYNSVGIVRGEKQKMTIQQSRNYSFFDAPVGLIFTMSKDMSEGSLLDMGMFMQSIMIAARAYGLDTCPEAAFIDYSTKVRALLDINDDEKLICGMALGFKNPDAPENNFVTERESVEIFAQFLED